MMKTVLAMMSAVMLVAYTAPVEAAKTSGPARVERTGQAKLSRTARLRIAFTQIVGAMGRGFASQSNPNWMAGCSASPATKKAKGTQGGLLSELTDALGMRGQGFAAQHKRW